MPRKSMDRWTAIAPAKRALAKPPPASLYCSRCRARLVCRACNHYFRDSVQPCQCDAEAACPDCDLGLVEVRGRNGRLLTTTRLSPERQLPVAARCKICNAEPGSPCGRSSLVRGPLAKLLADQGASVPACPRTHNDADGSTLPPEAERPTPKIGGGL